MEDSGNYTCVVENLLGKDNSTGSVHVQSSESSAAPGTGDGDGGRGQGAGDGGGSVVTVHTGHCGPVNGRNGALHTEVNATQIHHLAWIASARRL